MKQELTKGDRNVCLIGFLPRNRTVQLNSFSVPSGPLEVKPTENVFYTVNMIKNNSIRGVTIHQSVGWVHGLRFKYDAGNFK